MSQYSVVNGVYPELKFGSSLTEVVGESGAAWKDVHAVTSGLINGARVPVFTENSGQALIRLTHGSSIQASCSYQSMTNTENSSHAHRSRHVSPTHANDDRSPLFRTTASNSHESTHETVNNISSQSDMCCQINANKSDRTWNPSTSILPSIHDNQFSAPHLHLLQSKDNCRPSSRNSQHTSNSHHSISYAIERLETNCQNDEDSVISEENKRPKSRCASRKSKGKKNKKKKSRAKQQEAVNRLHNSNNKPKPVIISTAMTKQKTEPTLRNKSSETSLRFTNLSDVLQAQCKPLTIAKIEAKDKKDNRYTISAPGSVINKTAINGNKQAALLQISATPVHPDVKVPVLKSTSTFQPKRSEGNPYLQTGLYSQHAKKPETTKVMKIYLSEKHSGTLKDEGNEFPCAPPATPMPEQLSRVEYVPSMNDIRSQQAVRKKLQVLEREAIKKREIEKEKKLKEEKKEMKNREKETKIRQRNEIYALNKIMTELEFKNFQEFCRRKGIPV